LLLNFSLDKYKKRDTTLVKPILFADYEYNKAFQVNKEQKA